MPVRTMRERGGRSHGWGVNERKYSLQIAEAQRVEEHDVLVAKGGEESVLRQSRRSLLKLGIGAATLLVQRVDLVTAKQVSAGTSPEGRRGTHGKRPVSPNVSRSSILKPAPLFSVGSLSRARPRKAVQMGRYGK